MPPMQSSPSPNPNVASRRNTAKVRRKARLDLEAARAHGVVAREHEAGEALGPVVQVAVGRGPTRAWTAGSMSS